MTATLIHVSMHLLGFILISHVQLLVGFEFKSPVIFVYGLSLADLLGFESESRRSLCY